MKIGSANFVNFVNCESPGVPVTGQNIPATMSSVILQDKLRRELGYQNIIVTDAMDMGAITQQYTVEEAVVGSLQAGADIVLCSKDFLKAFDTVVTAVEDGTIAEERLNQSVRRILLLKLNSKL